MSDKTRQQDYKDIISLEKTATNKAERVAVDHAKYRLRNETQRIRAMRESLVKATRDGNHEEIKDIHCYVANHRDLQGSD